LSLRQTLKSRVLWLASEAMLWRKTAVGFRKGITTSMLGELADRLMNTPPT
jgi:hypothetical protein